MGSPPGGVHSAVGPARSGLTVSAAPLFPHKTDLKRGSVLHLGVGVAFPPMFDLTVPAKRSDQCDEVTLAGRRQRQNQQMSVFKNGRF